MVGEKRVAEDANGRKHTPFKLPAARSSVCAAGAALYIEVI